MNNKNQLVTQLASLAALLVAWFNPDAQLSSTVQTAVVAVSGAVVAGIHLVAALERKGGSGTTTTNPPADRNPGNGT